MQIRISVLLLTAMLCVTESVLARDWKGIRPLHSDKKEVANRLAGYKETIINECWTQYENDDEKVSISYICFQCSEGGNYNLPTGIVATIDVYPKRRLELAELNVRNEKLFRHAYPHIPHIYLLENDEEGYGYEVNNEKVYRYYYRAQRKEIKEKQCK